MTQETTNYTVDCLQKKKSTFIRRGSARRIYTSPSKPLTSDYEHTCHDIQRGRREDRCHDSTESPHIMPLGDRIQTKLAA